MTVLYALSLKHTPTKTHLVLWGKFERQSTRWTIYDIMEFDPKEMTIDFALEIFLSSPYNKDIKDLGVLMPDDSVEYPDSLSLVEALEGVYGNS